MSFDLAGEGLIVLLSRQFCRLYFLVNRSSVMRTHCTNIREDRWQLIVSPHPWHLSLQPLREASNLSCKNKACTLLNDLVIFVCLTLYRPGSSASMLYAKAPLICSRVDIVQRRLNRISPRRSHSTHRRYTRHFLHQRPPRARQHCPPSGLCPLNLSQKHYPQDMRTPSPYLSVPSRNVSCPS